MSAFHSEIGQLSPHILWQFFDKICSIPHPSKHEESLAQYIVEWATQQQLHVVRDAVGSIIIKKPATAGMENKKPVVLQAHLDMVPQKNEDTIHDFTTDPIQPYIDGEWVTAKGTTLGADNGIGMATCLAVLASHDLKHGPLEVLLTVDEESGMTGAFNLQPGMLDAEILLNTDSEQEGEVYMGCAGGINNEMSLTFSREAVPEDYVCRKLVIKGLKGGHSGADIHLGRGNANKLLARFLAEFAKDIHFKLIDFKGGSLRNAIPREAFATICLPHHEMTQLTTAYQLYSDTIQHELSDTEPSIVTSIEDCSATYQAMSQEGQNKFICLLNACPNGVIRMSDQISGVVETSLNVGVIETQEDSITILSLIRSLIDSGREETVNRLTSLATLAGADVRNYDAYPGWAPDTDSEIMALFRSTYEDMYGKKPHIMVIHAGLECGLFKQPYPNMDMISFGPTIKSPHSPDEKVNIKTVAQFWDQMVAILERIPDRH